MSKSKAWQQLERDTAAHFGITRNIKRGMDWSTLDTDVDVVNTGAWKNLIMDCKYRSNSEGALAALMKDVAAKTPKGMTPVIRFATDKYWYMAMRLEDLTPYNMTPCAPDFGWVRLNDNIPETFLHTEIARAGTKYLDEWFDKLIETYRPIKAEEFSKDEEDLHPAVVIRKKGVRQTVIVFRTWER